MVGDLFGFLWDVIAFLWQHFFDILEILFAVVFLGVIVGIVIAGVGLAEVIAGIRGRIRGPSSTASSRLRGGHPPPAEVPVPPPAGAPAPQRDSPWPADHPPWRRRSPTADHETKPVSPKEARLRKGDSRDSVGASFGLGSLLLSQGDLEGATEAFRRAAHRGHAQAALELGCLLRRSGDLCGAEAAFVRAEQLGHATAPAKLGELYRERVELAAAEDAFRRATVAHEAIAADIERGNELRATELRRSRDRSDASPEPFARSVKLPSRRDAGHRTKPRCDICGKVSYADAEEAWKAVTASHEMLAEGKRVDVLLDHAYEDPICGNWHTSSQPKRS